MKKPIYQNREKNQNVLPCNPNNLDYCSRPCKEIYFKIKAYGDAYQLQDFQQFNNMEPQ
jgi:hypothetical protein